MITAITLCPPLFEPGLHGLGESKWVKASQFYAQTMGISTKQPRDCRWTFQHHLWILEVFTKVRLGTMKNKNHHDKMLDLPRPRLHQRINQVSCYGMQVSCSDRGGRRGPDKTWWHCKSQFMFMESISLSSPFCLWSLHPSVAVHRRPRVQATCTETANLSLRTWNNPQERWSSPLDSNTQKSQPQVWKTLSLHQGEHLEHHARFLHAQNWGCDLATTQWVKQRPEMSIA